MSRFIRFVAVLLLVLIVLGSFLFASFNTTEAPLWLVVELSPRPVGQWVVAAFATGGLLGLILGFGVFNRIKTRIQMRQLKSRLHDVEQELASLQGLSRKDGK
ncbi:MAG: lipopolysaccharide assembly protein LapA domain-containing protein [Pseudomonadales bacterium]|nr:lipopolysaccharide assembly protein LapA domain-containing protein [Pseudomonadales bacterium]